MRSVEESIREMTDLNESQIAHLQQLASDWQLIADLSFADLAIWVPIKKNSGFIAMSHVRAATAATVFPKDFEGETRAALPSGESVESFSIAFNGQEIAQLTRHRNPMVTRSLGRLESTYQEIAQLLIEMVGEGTFPFSFAIS